jgi:phage N-6-adenine-methyltransferase
VLNPAAKGAAFNRGKSRQDYRTPRVFLDAIEQRFGPIVLDAAADSHNAVCPEFYSPKENALVQSWRRDGLTFCNPPFARIAPWAEKCRAEAARGARVALLVPAAVGSNWYRDNVHERARVYFLNGRISFDGKNGYPKDCMLAVFGEPAGFEVWRWR